MSAPATEDAAFRYTEDGQSFLHYLGGKLRRPVSHPVQAVHTWRSADLTTSRRIAIGSGVSDLTAELLYDGQPYQLEQLLAAGARGAALEYFPSLANPSESYPCEIVDHGDIQPDAQLWFRSRYQVSVRLRRIDGGNWLGLLTDSLFYYTAGNPMPGLVFTRTGTATYVDEDGVLQTAATGIARTTWIDGVPHQLLEEARTNLATSPEDFSSGAWTKVSTTVTANTGTGADGTATADHLESSAASTSRVTDPITISSNDDVGVSFFVEPDSTTWCYLVLFGPGGTDGARAWFNLATGAIGSTATFGTGYSVSNLQIDALADGRYRISAVWATGGDTAVSYGVALADGDADTASALGLDMWAWGAQVEVGASVSSYMGTTARNADTFYADFVPDPQEMTVYAKFIEHGTALAANFTRLMEITDASNNTPALQIDNGSGNAYRARHNNGTDAEVTSTSAASPVHGDIVELRLILGAGGSVQIGQSINGGAEVVASASSAPAAGLASAWAGTRLYINSHATGGRGTNAFETVKALPGISTMAEMRAA